MEVKEAIKVCEKFALEHKVIFDAEGECGFGRECVGFRDGNWIAHNPYDAVNYDPIEDYVCDDAYPPEDVTDAYHKHDCLAILGKGDDAIIQLALWVKHMENKGVVSIETYKTGASGIQAMLSGLTGRTVMINKSNKP